MVKQSSMVARLFAGLAVPMALVLSGGAMAQAGDELTGADRTGEGRRIETFVDLDRNDDGLLSEEEIDEGSPDADFDEIDSDGDGDVNRNEYFQYYRQHGL